MRLCAREAACKITYPFVTASRVDRRHGRAGLVFLEAASEAAGKKPLIEALVVAPL